MIRTSNDKAATAVASSVPHDVASTLSRRLDPHAGVTRRALLRHAKRRRVAGAVGATAAALSAGLIGWQMTPAAPPTEARSPVVAVQAWHTADAGTVEVAGVPARAYVTAGLSSLRFRDPAGFDVRIDVPTTDVALVNLPID